MPNSRERQDSAMKDKEESNHKSTYVANAAPPVPPPVSAESLASTPAARSSEDITQAALEQCLTLLKGSSDEHKFAGLVMVTKHVPALTGGDAGFARLRMICDAIGTPFVHRLLKTGGHERAAASNGGGTSGTGLSVYQHIALGVLAAFLQDGSLVPRFVTFAPTLARTVRAATSSAETQALCDALTCVQALADSPGGMERLLRAGAAQAAVSHLLLASRDRVLAHRNTPAGDMKGGPRAVGSGDAPVQDGVKQEQKNDEHTGVQFAARRWEDLAFAFVARAFEASGGNCLGPRELTAVAEAFRDDPTPAKFTFMDLLLRWMATQQNEEASSDVDPEGTKDLDVDYVDGNGISIGSVGGGGRRTDGRVVTLGTWVSRGEFPVALREGLVQALHGAAVDERRDSALALLALSLRVLGQAWAVEDGDDQDSGRVGGRKRETGSGPKLRRKRGTFVALSVKCAAGEIRILMDEALSILVPHESTSQPSKGGKGDEMQGKARGPMGPEGIDPSIGLAAELASKGAVTKRDGHENHDDAGRAGKASTDGGNGQVPSNSGLSPSALRAMQERRIGRLKRMMPVALGVVESTIAFLCGGGDGEDFEDGSEEDSEMSKRWEDLPVDTLQILQKTLVSVFGCVMDFMSELRPWIAPGARASRPGATILAVTEGEREPPSLMNLWNLRRLGLMCSRTLGIWMAEDPEASSQRFPENLDVLLALNANSEPPDSDDEESEDDDDDGDEDNNDYSYYASTELSGLAALDSFPAASRLAAGLLSLPSNVPQNTFHDDPCDGLDDQTPDEALLNILRATLALSYERASLVAIVEGGVTARLVRLVSAGPAAIAALLLGGAGSAEVPNRPLPPLEPIAEALRSPLITSCGLLSNILSSAGHLAWPENSGRRKSAGTPVAKSIRRSSWPSTQLALPSTHPVLAHPVIGECLASMAEIAGLAGAVRRVGGDARWRLLVAHATLVVMIVARAATPGSGLAPEHGLTKREMRWRGVKQESSSRSGRPGCNITIWEAMATAVDEALGSLSAVPGKGLLGGKGEDEEASYEEGSIWQWCVECAHVMEVSPGGVSANAYVSGGVLPEAMLRSLKEAATDGRL